MTVKSSPDWFARGTALAAILLTAIGLPLTYRNQSLQTKMYQEGLEERILVRVDFEYTFKINDGVVGVDVVNAGMHPIYVKTVRIEVLPNECGLISR